MPNYTHQQPKLIDPSGVKLSLKPRPIGTSTGESRAQVVHDTQGQPSVDFNGHSNPYNDYQSVDLLLSLQHPRSTGYDEHVFCLMAQVKELLFKALHFELYNAQQQICGDAVGNALDILVRAKALVAYLANSWDVLSTISPEGYNQFRDHLSTASGQMSFMYRHVEFVLGNKSCRLARAFRNMPHVWPGIQQSLESPSLYDEVIRLLARRGHDIAATALERDWSEDYRPDESVEKAWLAVYAQPGPDNELYRLAESLVALSDGMSQYRWRHFTTVQRLIGLKPGTGGSAGVGWLEQVLRHRFFPELWSIRTQF